MYGRRGILSKRICAYEERGGYIFAILARTYQINDPHLRFQHSVLINRPTKSVIKRRKLIIIIYLLYPTDSTASVHLP